MYVHYKNMEDENYLAQIIHETQTVVLWTGMQEGGIIRVQSSNLDKY